MPYQTDYPELKQLQFTANQDLLLAFDTPQMVYYLHKGFVRQYVINSDGSELTVHIFKPGSYFPLITILAEQPNHYNFTSITLVELATIDKQVFLESLSQNPEKLMLMTKNLLIALDKLSKRIEQLAFADAQTRLVETLKFLSRHFATKQGSDWHFQYKFTHAQLANFAGLSRETVSRELMNLESAGKVSYDEVNKLILLISP